MAKGLHKPTSNRIKVLKTAGRYSDGGGLYCKVFKGGSKSWVFMWVRNGKRREMGMGAVKDLTLANARIKAGKMRELIREGKDPIAERKKLDEPTFLECALAYICLLYTSPSPRDQRGSRMPSSA